MCCFVIMTLIKSRSKKILDRNVYPVRICPLSGQLRKYKFLHRNYNTNDKIIKTSLIPVISVTCSLLT